MKRFTLLLILVSILLAEDKDKLIIDVEQSLMATCCWSGTVYDHGNKEMEMEIAGMVNAGKSKTEILSHFTEKFGERVLAVPKAEGFNIFAWLAPIFIGGLGLIIVLLYLSTPKDVNVITENSKSDSVAFSDEIERELKELD